MKRMLPFLIKTSEHLITAAYFWGWIYYDFSYVFQQKPGFEDFKPMLNATKYGAVCIINRRFFLFKI